MRTNTKIIKNNVACFILYLMVTFMRAGELKWQSERKSFVL